MWNSEGLLSKLTVLKADFLYIELEDLSLLVCMCTFQPENVMGWGSEGVKANNSTDSEIINSVELNKHHTATQKLLL